MTQLEQARQGKITALIRRVAGLEGVQAETIRKGMAAGHIVVPHNRLRKMSKPCAIGAGLSTKINANIGTSKDSSNIAHELEKMDIAIRSGADAVMDLSTGPRLVETRRAIMRKACVPIGTVPIYEMVRERVQETIPHQPDHS